MPKYNPTHEQPPLSEFEPLHYVNFEQDNPYDVAILCKRLGTFSAQNTVYLLPEAYNTDVIVDEETLETTAMRRVLKIAHSYTQTENTIATLSIVPSEQYAAKVDELINNGINCTMRALIVAQQSAEANLLLGNPYLCPNIRPAWQDGYHMAYTQDYSPPLAATLNALDMTKPSDVRRGMSIIDACVDTQLKLSSFGLFEWPFKFTDNFGLSPLETEFPTDQERIRVLDLGELSSDEMLLRSRIDNKEWEKIVERPEYTQLSVMLQEYLNKQCEERLTQDAVTQVWNKAPSRRAINGEVQSYENHVPHELPHILWKMTMAENRLWLTRSGPLLPGDHNE